MRNQIRIMPSVRRALTVRRLLTVGVCGLVVGLSTTGTALAAGVAEVTFEGSGTGTVTSNPSGIDCTDVGGATTGECSTTELPFSIVPNIELTATPGPGSQFEGWGSEGAGECMSSTTNPCSYGQGILTYKFTAIFGATGPQQPLKVTLTGAGGGEVTSSPGGIECGTTCEAQFAEGSTVVLSAKENEHSTFAGWTGCGNVNGDDQCEVTMSEARAVEAEFHAIPQETLEVQNTGSGSGEVNSSPAGIACGATCTADFNEGSTVVLTATPSPPAPGSRYTFGGWKRCSNVTGEEKCEVTMSEAKTVEAEFVRVPQQTLKVQESGTGSGEVTSAPPGIACGGTCEAEFDEGATVTLTATSANGSHFAGWSGGGCSGTQPCEVTLAAATTVTATFELVPSPTATTGAASDITSTTALLDGAVNGEGYDTHYLFEYGETESYGSEAPEDNGVGEDAGITATSTPVTIGLSGLTPNTTYHYRIVAYNILCIFGCPPSGPNTADGSDRTFTTLPSAPAVATDVPIDVEATRATVAGEVIAQGADTSYQVEYGTAEALGTGTAPIDAGSASSGRYVTATLEGLSPETTYFYRFAATNSGGDGHGQIASFTTNAAGEPGAGGLPPGFSLAGAFQATLPLASFPSLASLGPPPAVTVSAPSKPKPVTRARKLAAQLKRCKKDKSKSKRQRCEREARKQYGSKSKTTKRP